MECDSSACVCVGSYTGVFKWRSLRGVRISETKFHFQSPVVCCWKSVIYAYSQTPSKRQMDKKTCPFVQCAMLHRNLSGGRRGGNPVSTNKCKIFGQLIIRNINKIIAIRCHILRLKCTKFDSWRLSVCLFVSFMELDTLSNATCYRCVQPHRKAILAPGGKMTQPVYTSKNFKKRNSLRYWQGCRTDQASAHRLWPTATQPSMPFNGLHPCNPRNHHMDYYSFIDPGGMKGWVDHDITVSFGAITRHLSLIHISEPTRPY